jgi:Glycosyl hydrolase family 3 N terminal domain
VKFSRFLTAVFLLASSAAVAQQPERAPYLDTSLTPQQRAADLVSRMTLEEKVLQMQSTAPAIERLGVPAYNWWNEAMHGVMQGRATVFPQAIGLAATWDTELRYRVADIISSVAVARPGRSRACQGRCRDLSNVQMSGAASRQPSSFAAPTGAFSRFGVGRRGRKGRDEHAGDTSLS